MTAPTGATFKLLGSYCFYHAIKEQYLAIKEGSYHLLDLGADTMITSGVMKEIPDNIKDMMVNIFGPISDFMVVPVDLIDWNEHGILTPDFTQAVEASRW
jgi:hypothetical protein